MISNRMYDVLSSFPNYPKEGIYTDILRKSGLDEETFKSLILDAMYSGNDYVNTQYNLYEKTKLSLTEKGQAEVECYEQAQKDSKTSKKALRTSRCALFVAILALLGLIPNISEICEFFKALWDCIVKQLLS